MRDILREFPQIYLARQNYLSDDEFIEIIKSTYARRSDLKLSKERIFQIKEFQISYLELIFHLQKEIKKDFREILLEVIMRSSVINKYERVTGDSISHIVQKVQRKKPKFTPDDLFQIASEFSVFQDLNPDRKEISSNKMILEFKPQKHIMRNLYLIVRDFREGL
jgi:hypothetical protein